ncbi:hypothetical protein [Chamaesiphon sp.]|uniref:hypothetical protein n=1 Tax=Chamaesiphon sp. TaxID=2814140 RepID=UPI0035938CFF
MLKYLFIIGTTVIANLALVITAPTQIATAIDIVPSVGSNPQDKLITKDLKPLHINTQQQQSDVKSIHEVLTQYYRGFNEYSIERMERVSMSVTAAEKKYLQGLFSKLKSARVDMSVEVKNIELVSLSANNAVVNVEQVMKGRGLQKSMISQQSASIGLLKYRGKWKISDGNTVINSLERGR